MIARHIASVLAVFIVTASAIAPSGDATAQQAAEPCEAWDIEYSLAAKLQLTDTPKDAGNGIYAIGPGSTVLRFANVNGSPGGTVHMRSYSMRENFKIDSKVVFWTTHVLTNSKTTTTPNACGDVAKGDLQGSSLSWRSTIAGYRTDGTINCDGSLCGKFGAPPPGDSELHIPVHTVNFSPFQFGPNMKTFTMPSTEVSKTESPKQTAHITLAGREVRRTCAAASTCQ